MIPPLTGITAFVGLNGAGKTLAMTEALAVAAWRQGRRTIANYALYPDRVGYDAELHRALGSWRDIPRLGRHLDEGKSLTGNEGCNLLLDEMNATLPARQFASVPAELVRVLHQLRKHDVTVGWSAPAWDSADKALRQVTRQVVVCKGKLPDRYKREPVRRMFPPAVRNASGKGYERHKGGWAPNRLFSFACYAAEDFEEFSLDRARLIKPMWAVWYWRTRHQGFLAYDTSESIDLLDHLDHTGVCPHCDGARSRHKCKCPVQPYEAAGSPEGAEAAPRWEVLAS